MGKQEQIRYFLLVYRLNGRPFGKHMFSFTSKFGSDYLPRFCMDSPSSEQQFVNIYLDGYNPYYPKGVFSDVAFLFVYWTW
jgi:hypothetical protein